MPYTKLAILDEHPLLWNFKYDDLVCEHSGNLKNHHEFTSKLQWLYEEKTGGFVNWRRDFHELQRMINGKNKINISLNMKTYNFVKHLFEEFKLSVEFSNITSGGNKGYNNKPTLKILIFGNPDVCPNDYNLGQPYILAEEFNAFKIE